MPFCLTSPSNQFNLLLTKKTSAYAEGWRIIHHSTDAFEVFSANWSNQIGLVEEFNVLYLDNRNRVLAFSTMAKGTINNLVIDLRVVFAGALLNRATALLLAHNHPSGNSLRQSYKIMEASVIAGKIEPAPLPKKNATPSPEPS